MSMQLHLSQIADVLGSATPNNDVTVTGAVIDSRQIKVGDLFVALTGDHVDGHDYIAAAREAGASAALVSQQQDDELPQLVVDDVSHAFGQLMQYWRQQCTAKIVAITGSNGKTTVKEMVASILNQHGSVVATLGNLNNELGVPLTLARLDKKSDYAVIEMGANHAGEIARLVDIVKPQVALINNVAPAHLEGFGDINGVASAKEEIYAGLTEQGIGIVNADDDFSDDWKVLLADKEVVSFSLESDADITAKDLQMSATASHFMVALDGVLHYVNLPLPGKHNVANALAAIAITRALEIPESAIVKGLAAMQSVPHRLQLRAGLNQSQLIDDSYNANPGSYQQALKTLQGFSGEHWLVLGDFGELGSDSDDLHYQMGLDAKSSGITRLLTIGESSKNASKSFGGNALHFDDMSVLKQQLQQDLVTGVTCLIKGSRFMQLDKLADMLAIGRG